MMISIDFECKKEHRFEGSFRDYDTFRDQLERGMIQCPLCASPDVRRIFRGCSINSKTASAGTETPQMNLFQAIRAVNNYVRSNFRDVGASFAETARSIHHGLSEEQNVFGTADHEEIKELADEGILVLPMIDPDRFEN